MILLSGCAAGPNYSGPPDVALGPGEQQSFARAEGLSRAEPSSREPWWRGLNDPLLSSLIEQALQDSPTIAMAEARIREARGNLRAERASLFPSLGLSAAYARMRLPEGLSSNSELYGSGMSASWEPDLWGGKHDGVQRAQANVGQQFAALADAQVSLSAQVAQTYVSLRSGQERVRLVARSMALLEEASRLVEQRFEAGVATRAELEQLRQERGHVAADLAELRGNVAVDTDRLSVLCGRAPTALDSQLNSPVAKVPLPPSSVFVGNPRTMLGHRPDVRAAERALAAATAEVGARVAARFPQVKFAGILGLGGSSAKDLIDPGQISMLLAPQISWSFLDFGRTKARVEAAQAGRDVAAAHYRETVLGALEDAEASLARFGQAREQLAHTMLSDDSLGRMLALQREKQAAGTVSRLALIDLERQKLTASVAVVETQARVTASFISVQKALGLGWSAER
ncbi:efflux transporter outer membrane subunit [Novosphingobium sp. 1949]|uniref:Efflux transporter outer membrane subunit n=1 Tax=Novosphingobium organovorum TaxID=2930092 RepID=A0ABT0BDH6_9SPHN|nr:efflux transporter outer membrane subunit [Novosphingobium organovorum]MCJ2182898.1 efflux transporter outer membrane subunit [Novosphingobium organovorum]